MRSKEGEFHEIRILLGHNYQLFSFDNCSFNKLGFDALLVRFGRAPGLNDARLSSGLGFCKQTVSLQYLFFFLNESNCKGLVA